MLKRFLLALIPMMNARNGLFGIGLSRPIAGSLRGVVETVNAIADNVTAPAATR